MAVCALLYAGVNIGPMGKAMKKVMSFENWTIGIGYLKSIKNFVGLFGPKKFCSTPLKYS